MIPRVHHKEITVTILRNQSAETTPRIENCPDNWVVDLPKNGGQVIRVAVERYNGSDVITAHLWSMGLDGQLRRRYGLTLAIRHLPGLAQAFSDALQFAVARNLV